MLLLLCSLSALLQSGAGASIRGAPPSLHSAYDTTSDTFRCLDGSRTLPRVRVNDDYCDCGDGSDEPGEREYKSFVVSSAAHRPADRHNST